MINPGASYGHPGRITGRKTTLIIINIIIIIIDAARKVSHLMVIIINHQVPGTGGRIRSCSPDT